MPAGCQKKLTKNDDHTGYSESPFDGFAARAILKNKSNVQPHRIGYPEITTDQAVAITCGGLSLKAA
jgi:hypothetical protein